MGTREPKAVVTSGWYAANIGEGFVAIEDAIGRGPLARALGRLRAVRGLQIHLAARRGRGAALLRLERGALTALCLAAVLGGPPVVILELIPDRPPRSPWKRVLARARFALVERPAVRRGMRAGQVLSAAERDRVAAAYGIPPERLRHVPWALCRTGTASPEPPAGRAGVLSSGRAACDWETLFEAAAGAAWPLTVVCGAADRERVEALNRDGRARILSEVSREHHDRLVGSTAVFAIVLVDDGLSSGQVRLMTATELRAPVVVSAVETLADYVVDGETAVAVPVGDPARLRSEIDAMLADPERAGALAGAALERARARTYRDYFRDVGAMVDEVLG